jgi:transcriptional regulator with XRE-family HTH domain
MQERRSKGRTPPTGEQLFGVVLREIRTSRGISQEELAFGSGYHPTYIGQLERGKKSPSLRTIMRLASVLEVTGSDILKQIESRLGGL